jgi:hypothetical protein
MAHRHVLKANGGDYSTVATIGLTFLQASHDATEAMQREMNSLYAEESGILMICSMLILLLMILYIVMPCHISTAR